MLVSEQHPYTSNLLAACSLQLVALRHRRDQLKFSEKTEKNTCISRFLMLLYIGIRECGTPLTAISLCTKASGPLAAAMFCSE